MGHHGYDGHVDLEGLKVALRGSGDIGSAVAHRLFLHGCAVVIHEVPLPTTTRRGMAFTDAVFDRQTQLEGINAMRADEFGQVEGLLASRQAIPVYVGPFGRLLEEMAPDVLVDARMRKHEAPEGQRGLADFTISLGPDLVAGQHADRVIETSWDGLGRVISRGGSMTLAGEPREIEGHGRDRYVYAPLDGVFRTRARIADKVRRGEEVAEIDPMVLTAPLDGVLRGLTHDGVPVTVWAKVIEVDPRGATAEVRGIGERPRRISEGVLQAISEWQRPGR